MRAGAADWRQKMLESEVVRGLLSDVRTYIHVHIHIHIHTSHSHFTLILTLTYAT